MKSSMNVKANQEGFTLIELVVVIVILGILAVTAAPKFIDLTGDAKASTIQAVKGSLNSAADMAHAKSLVNGTLNDAISIAGKNINFKNGYPTKESINDLMDIEITANVSDAVFVLAVSGNAATYSYKGSTTPTSCQTIYNEAVDTDNKPSITSNTTDCN
jgi:MSHA pilin protein MshA